MFFLQIITNGRSLAAARPCMFRALWKAISVICDFLVIGGGIWNAQSDCDGFSAAKVVNAAGAWADRIGAMAGAKSTRLTPKRRTAIIIRSPDRTNCAALPSVDLAGSDADLKPEGEMLMASPGDATPSAPQDAWPDDLDSAILADWIEQVTTIQIARIEHSWEGLRSFVADETLVVGFDPVVPGFFWLAGRGGYGITLAPTSAILVADLGTGEPRARLKGIVQVLSPQRFQ